MRVRTGCQPCRDRHIKCVKRPDADQCDKCIEHRRQCVQKTIHRFRPVKSVVLKARKGRPAARQSLAHDPLQVWVDLPNKLDFATNDTDSTITDEVGSEGDQPQVSSSQHDNPILHPIENEPDPIQRLGVEEWTSEPSYPASVPIQMNRLRGTSSEQRHDFPQGQLTSPASRHSYHHSPAQQIGPSEPALYAPLVVSPITFHSSPSHHSVRSEHRTTYSVDHASPLLSLSPAWPFQSPREAQLFYHYIKRISPWIDVLDNHGYFSKEIPRRAAQHPVISNAIFAFASRHLSILAETEDHESPKYVDECLNLVINILEDPLGHSDENLLAAVILLRSHEEMSDIDERCHLLGTSRILNSIASHAADGGFKESASWISLRQAIYISLTSQQPLSLNLSNYRHSGVFSDQTDESWANRIVFTFANILNYVLGEHHDPSRWSDLEAEAEAWNLTKPWHFSPLWTKWSNEESRPWPELQTSHPAHVVGLQYYCLCKIVLSIYDPHLTKLGFASHRLRKASEATVVENLRITIGLAVSNPDVTNAMFQASHILSVCGSYLHDPKDQEAAVEFLIGMQRSMGWRTTQIIRDLREQWKG